MWVFFGRWEVIHEKRHVTARLVRPSLSLWQYAPDIVEEDGFDIDIGEESVLVEEHRAYSVVGHVEPVREELVVKVFNRFLQCDDMPLACDFVSQ